MTRGRRRHPGKGRRKRRSGIRSRTRRRRQPERKQGLAGSQREDFKECFKEFSDTEAEARNIRLHLNTSCPEINGAKRAQRRPTRTGERTKPQGRQRREKKEADEEKIFRDISLVQPGLLALPQPPATDPSQEDTLALATPEGTDEHYIKDERWMLQAPPKLMCRRNSCAVPHSEKIMLQITAATPPAAQIQIGRKV